MNPDDAWAWIALDAALREVTPPCDGDPLFTAERLTDREREHCADLCARCPLLDLCDDYAMAVMPPAGFWAGYLYSAKGKH